MHKGLCSHILIKFKILKLIALNVGRKKASGFKRIGNSAWVAKLPPKNLLTVQLGSYIEWKVIWLQWTK